MNLFDISVIYLTFGAPLAVKFFFQNRKKEKNFLLARAFFVLIFWLPFAAELLLQNASIKLFLSSLFVKAARTDAEKDDSLFLIQKEFENLILVSRIKNSLFEFREVFERYGALNQAILRKKSEPTQIEKNIFLAANSQNANLSARCLNRRNRIVLSNHHKLARRDFLQFFEKLFEFHSDKEKLRSLAIRFFTLLKDFEAKDGIEKILSAAEPEFVKNSSRVIRGFKKDLWNEEAKLLTTNPISFNLKPSRQTTIVSSKTD